MIITVGGSIASGKTTLAKRISEKFGLKHISAGIVMRDAAKERNMSLIEFSKFAEGNPEIDQEIDARQKKLSEMGNCVVDGRLSAHFIDSGLKIWLTAPIKVRASRAFTRDKFKNINESIDKVTKREASEKKRYKEFYGIDLDDMKIYDLILNTEKWDIDAMCEVVFTAIYLYQQQTILQS